MLRKSLSVLAAMMMVMFLASAASAALWKVEATNGGDRWSDWWATFDDADGDMQVSIDDLIDFSGVTRYEYLTYFSEFYGNTYEELQEIQTWTIGSLQLIGSTSDDEFKFYSPDGVGDPFGGQGADNSPDPNPLETSFGSNPTWDMSAYTFTAQQSEVPVPAAVWLLGSGLLGLAGLRRKMK